MLEFFTRFFGRFLGSQHVRNLERLKGRLSAINQHQVFLAQLSDDALRAEIDGVRKILDEALSEERAKIAALKEALQREKKDLKKSLPQWAAIEESQEKIDKITGKILDDQLPLVFAVVRETARRFKEKEELVVFASQKDREFAALYPHIVIENDRAHYQTTWEVGGDRIKWDMVHYDVQMMGGIVLHEGKIAEMGTGEGKTLVATLPAFLNALSGKGVHIITVNDYLSRRDQAWMAPLFLFHGLSVDCIENYPAYSAGRRQAYRADITYGTGNEFGFDYLRDNMAMRLEKEVQRGFYYGILDEIDSVLIDEAKTPLIISGPMKGGGNQAFKFLKPHVQALYQAQKKIVDGFLLEAKKAMDSEKKDAAGLPLFRIYRGLPKSPALIDLLAQKGIRQLLAQTEDYYMQENKKMMPEADEPLLFTIDESTRSVELTDKGIEFLSKKNQDPDFFILPDVTSKLAKLESEKKYSAEEKISERKKILEDYGVKYRRVDAIHQLLKAYTLFQKNLDYVVMNQKIKIVDDKTGRILEGRRYSHVHPAIEAKEGVKIERNSQTYATITPQNQFRMYKKLSGMTGTAATEAAEFWDIYKLEVVVIPPNKPSRRLDHDDKIYKTEHEKIKAIAEDIEESKKSGRPILVITPSVEVSEQLRKTLQVAPRQLLNAKNHHMEAAIIARAGQRNALTIATQMAGRGTDIKLSPEALEAGGLKVIIVEKNENRRL